MQNTKKRMVRAAKLDALAIGAVAIAIYALCVQVDAFDHLVELSREHEAWEFDEIFATLMILPVAITAFAVRRLKDALRELKNRVEAERIANDLALRDPLTRLYNRRGFSRLAYEAATAGKQSPFLLALIDLNRFKAVNDLRGHAVGDQLLIAVAARLSELGPPDATVARLGGDEFVMLIPEIRTEVEERKALEMISTSFGQPFRLGQHVVRVGASIGARWVCENWTDVDILLSQADTALYKCKSKLTNEFITFRTSTEQRRLDSSSLADQLQHAASGPNISPHYQPLVCLKTGKNLGFEVLARWRLDDGFLRMPDEFIGIAENNGIINELFFNILRQASREISSCPEHYSLSLNLSATQFEEDSLVKNIVTVLAEAGISPERLAIEMTENAITSQIDSATKLIHELNCAGIKVAVDNFGVGLSSMKILSDFDIQIIKIDRSLVHMLKSNENQQRVVRSITSMAHNLGLKVVVEGIEDIGTADWISELGCDIGQGFYFGRPSDSAKGGSHQVSIAA